MPTSTLCISRHTHPPSTQCQAATSLLCFAFPAHFLYLEPYNMWPFVPGFLSLSIMCLRFFHIVALINCLFLFYHWIIIHCIARPHFIYLSTSWWMLELFLSLAILNSAAVNSYVEVSVRPYFSFLFSKNPWVECLGHVVTLGLIFEELPGFSRAAEPFHSLTSSVCRFQLPHCLVNTCYFLSFLL